MDYLWAFILFPFFVEAKVNSCCELYFRDGGP